MRIGEVRNGERARFGKPLEGVRILAAEQMQALPYATRLLAALGADVVKVEPPGRGESGRGGRPSLVDDDGLTVGATYLRNNLDKRSLTLDLKSEAGRALFLELVPRFDVVAENFTPGAMQRLGLAYEDVAAVHPETIYVSISGFGHSGDSPYARWPAYAPVVEAMAGLYEPNRRGDDPPPVVVAGALGDNGSALFAVIGVMAALQHRERTGLGQHVDISMYDSMLAMADMVPHLWSMGAPSEWARGGSLGIVAAFRARDGFFVLSVLRPHQFQRLARLIGRPEWIGDPRFDGLEAWAAQIETTVRPAVEAWARDRTKLEASRILCEEGIAAGPSNVAADIAADPHVARRAMLLEVPRPDSERPMQVVGNPVKLSRMAEGPVRRFPRLGEHTDEVLAEILGLAREEIAQLRERGVI